MNENDAAAADIKRRAQIAQQLQGTESVRTLASNAKRLISQAPFDGADAPQVAAVLAWLDATIDGSEKQIMLLRMESEGKLVPSAAPIKPEVVNDGN